MDDIKNQKKEKSGKRLLKIGLGLLIGLFAFSFIVIPLAGLIGGLEVAIIFFSFIALAIIPISLVAPLIAIIGLGKMYLSHKRTSRQTLLYGLYFLLIILLAISPFVLDTLFMK